MHSQKMLSARVMKSEERHQLAKNDLQTGLNSWLDRIEPYSNHIMGGVVLATVVAVGLIIWSRSTANADEAGWAEISSARTADQLLDVAEKNPGTAAADWATLQAARMSYSNGIGSSLTNRKASDDDLKQSKDLFEKLVKAKTSPELREEALKGLAMTLEATSGGDVGEAIKAYETLIKEFPESPFKEFANHRVSELKKPEATEFYAWFRKQNPKPADRPLPLDGKSATDNPLKTPDLPGLDLVPDKSETAPKADKKDAPALPSVPPTEGATPPVAPPATPMTPPATTPVTPPAAPLPEVPATTPPEAAKPAPTTEKAAEAPPAAPPVEAPK